jgi:hypothetical protein
MGDKKTPVYLSPSPEGNKKNELSQLSTVIKTISRRNEFSGRKQTNFMTRNLKNQNLKLKFINNNFCDEGQNWLTRKMGYSMIKTKKRPYPFQKLLNATPTTNLKSQKVLSSVCLFEKKKNKIFENKNKLGFLDFDCRKLNDNSNLNQQQVLKKKENSIKLLECVRTPKKTYKLKQKCPSINRSRQELLKRKKIESLLRNPPKINNENIIRLSLFDDELIPSSDKSQFDNKKLNIPDKHLLFKNKNILSVNAHNKKSNNHFKKFASKVLNENVISFTNKNQNVLIPKQKNLIQTSKIKDITPTNPFDSIFSPKYTEKSPEVSLRKSSLNPNVVSYFSKKSSLFDVDDLVFN